jgi:hypothetical protein
VSENINLTDAQLDSIMAQISKLINMRDHPSASTGEAANAAAMVQKLLAKYNLTLSEIESRDKAARPESEFGRHDFDMGVSQGYQMQWRSDIMWMVAQFNWCRAVRFAGTPGRARFNSETFKWERSAPTNARMVLIGKAFNVRVCIELFEYLVTELDRLSRDAWKQYAKLTPGREGYKTREYESRMFKNSFIQGAVGEIYERLARQYRESQGEAGMNALMVVSEAALATEVAKHFPRLGKAHASRMSGNSDAYAAGQHVGRTMNLTPTRKIESSGSARRRLS